MHFPFAPQFSKFPLWFCWRDRFNGGTIKKPSTFKKSMKTLLALAFLIPSLALTCINDRDTLAFEKRNVDALNRIEKETDPRKKSEAIQELVLRAIGGRFERYPAKYYEMRIERLLKKGTLTAPEYDDLAVAYDRLGKIDDAIRILLASKSSRTAKEEKYSFHANYGTFLVHRWIAKGHKDDDIATLKMSIAEIKKALEINPKSHFGRENVQLALEESWLPENRSDQFIYNGHFGNSYKLDSEEILIGVSGIIMMGLGYELPDVYDIISGSNMSVSSAGRSLQAFASFRKQELLKAGGSSVQPIWIDPKTIRSMAKVMSQDKVEIAIQRKREAILKGLTKSKPSQDFIDLRADGERVHQARMEYIEERFKRNEHPDTHPEFWAHWKEPVYPVLRKSLPKKWTSNPGSITLIVIVIGLFLTGGSLLVRTILRRQQV